VVDNDDVENNAIQISDQRSFGARTQSISWNPLINQEFSRYQHFDSKNIIMTETE